MSLRRLLCWCFERKPFAYPSLWGNTAFSLQMKPSIFFFHFLCLFPIWMLKRFSPSIENSVSKVGSATSPFTMDQSVCHTTLWLLWWVVGFCHRFVNVMTPPSSSWVLGTLRNRTAGRLRMVEWQKMSRKTGNAQSRATFFSSFCRPESSSRPVAKRSFLTKWFTGM